MLIELLNFSQYVSTFTSSVKVQLTWYTKNHLLSFQKQAEGPKPFEGRKFEKDNAEVRARENPRESGVKGKSSIREGGKGRHDDEGGVSAPAKPSGRVSLFDFLEDKLPLGEFCSNSS